MPMQEEFKRYFWYALGVLGVLLFWAGFWDGVASLPYLENPFLSLAVGILLLSLSKKIFKEADFFSSSREEIMIPATVKKVLSHPQKNEFQFKYNDTLKNKEQIMHARNLKRVEKGFLVFLDKGREVFIPLHRISSVTHKGKVHWEA